MSVDFSGKRERVDEEMMVSLIHERLPSPESVTTLKLSTKSYSAEAATVLAAQLVRMTSLTELDAADIISGIPEAEANEVLLSICTAISTLPLRRVDLSDNALGLRVLGFMGVC